MASYRVTATSRTEPKEQSITHLWVDSGNREIPYSVSQVIRMLTDGDSFYVGLALAGLVVHVEAMPPSSPTYVRTRPDGLLPNNLLSLPVRPTPALGLGLGLAGGLLGAPLNPPTTGLLAGLGSFIDPRKKS